MGTKTLARLALVALTAGTLGSVWSAAQAQNWRDRGYGESYRSRWGYRTSVMVPAGTPIDVRLETRISTDDNHSGDTWTGTVYRSVVSGGRVALPAGTPVSGVVVNSVEGTHDSRPQLDLAVRTVTVDGRTLRLNGETEPIVGGSQRAKKIGAVVGGAAAGALIGNMIGDRKGSVIGGLLGGAAGYGLTRHALRTMQLKPGAVVTFTAREDVVARRW
jgi:Glycine zipper 2TM domain